MFPSAGYFRSTDCPFFVHGLCHRPYCHFRHSKAGNSSQGECTKTGGGTSKVRISFYSHNSNNDKTTKTIDYSPAKTHIKERKGILKETDDRGATSKEIRKNRENAERKLPAYVPTSAAYSLAVKGEPVPSVKPQFGSRSSDEVELTDLTEEEKSIVFTGISRHVKESKKASSTNQRPSAGETGVQNKIEESLSHSFTSSVLTDVSKTTTTTGVISKDNSTIKEAACSESNEALLKDTATSSVHKVQSGMPEGKEQAHVSDEKAGSNVNKKSAVKDESQMISKLKTEGKGEALKRPLKKEKRRRSIVLSEEEIKKKRKSAPGGNPEISEPGTSSRESPEKKDQVVRHSKGEKKRLKGSNTGVSHNECKPESKKKIMELSHVDVFSVPNASTKSKHNVKYQEGSPSKRTKSNTRHAKYAVKSEEMNTKVNIGGNSGSNKYDIIILESEDEVSNLPEVYDVSPKPKRFKTESDESGLNNPVFSESDSEEEMSDSPGEAELKKIYNEYQPHELQQLKQTTVSVSDNQASVSRHYRTDPVTPKKEDSIADKLGLGKKQRVAHNSSYLPRRLSINANPVRRYPKILTAVQQSGTKQGTPPSPACRPRPGSSASPGGMVTASHKPIKHRVAHGPKTTDSATMPRPRIVLEYGAKVPQSHRQRYLDRIVDEYLRLCTSQKEAYDKALNEEKSMYDRATRRQVYINLCINAIKKLRNEPSVDNSAAVTGLSTEVQDPECTMTHTKVAATDDVGQSAVAQSGSAELTEDSFCEKLTKYLLDEDGLKENGYPRTSPTTPGSAVITRKKPQRAMSDPTRRICRRCGKFFVILEDGEYQRKEQCVYHYGKLWKRRSAGELVTSFSCCQGDAGSAGCCVGEVHVSENVGSDDGFMTTIVSPLADKKNKIFGLDCEMCYTTAGLELTRATVVDWKLGKVYDTFVTPDRPIVDYNTRFSGVTEESLRDVNTSLREVQAVLLSIIHKGSILIGHSLESDLIAVKLIHSSVVDTSVVFPHRRGPPYKRALRNLMTDHLQKIIQDSEGGHDSFEDAAAAVELMRWKVKEDSKIKARNRKGSR